MAWGSRIYRAALTTLLILTIALAVPRPAAAAPIQQVVLAFDIVGVKEDESVVIRTKDFPVRTSFTILIDIVGKQAVGGKQVGSFNSEKGGVIEQTVAIPESLRGELILAIRVESKDGYYAASWFINEDIAYKPLNAAVKPELSFSEVKKNQTVTVTGKNFPPEFSFSVRAGPFHTFYRDYTFLDRVRSEADGSVKFTLAIPTSAKDADYIMVRLDGAGMAVFNNFQNVDGGATVAANKLYKFQWCQVVSTVPVGELSPHEEFDAVWTVQNTANAEWELGTVDYKFIGGEELYKYESAYDIAWKVGKAEVFDIAVDMIAPDTFAGWHSTTWALVRAGEEMCRLKISVFVKDS